MPTDASTVTVTEAFFQPLVGLAEASKHTRPCPELSDELWVRAGILRVLEEVPSGRGFLQRHGPRLESTPKVSNYFSSLHSTRRADVLQDVVEGVQRAVGDCGVDRLAHLPELAKYVCFAVDMHWHQAATHDDRYDGKKVSVGHAFSLNLHNHGVRHLAAAEGEHEHDMSVMQRLKPKGLRQGVPKGKRVLVVYDRAGIDYTFWRRCRQEVAVYFLSRTKSNMVFEWEREQEWDRGDTRNRGVLHDQWVKTPEGHSVRLIEYEDPETGNKFQFLTNEPDLPPGVLAELYRRRWEVEKVFDEFKNKLGEKKAWASSQEARTIQGRFAALTENLLILYERRLEREHGIQNEAEDRRREQRLGWAARMARSAGRTLSLVLLRARQATQRSVKFIRWLQGELFSKLAEALAVARLRQLYATL
jgi:hypothetical protein